MAQNLRVKLILPALAEADNNWYRPIKYSLFPPLGLALLAGYLNPDDKVVLCDQHVEPLETEDADSFDLIAIQVYITNAGRAYAIADSYRKKGCFVVLGGLHPTSLPEEALAHADALVLGPAHQAWPEFLRDFRHGLFRKNKNQNRIYRDYHRSLDSLPPVRRDLIRRERYLVPNSTVASRGCPQTCDFCYTRNFFEGGKHFYTRKTDQVLSEIAALPGRHLFFLDDNLFGSPLFARSLFEGMAGMGRLFQGAATLRSLEDDSLLKLAAKSGLRSLFIGFESLNPDSLAACHKTINRVEDYSKVVKRLHSHGIMVNASFVFGLDGDTESVFDRTVEWAVSCGVESATFHLATPYPGTPFFQRLLKENRILHKNWDLYDTRHAVIRHPKLSPVALESGYERSYRTFYGWNNLFRGAFAHDSIRESFQHFAYAAAWKKMDPLWNVLIRMRMLPTASRLLELVLKHGGESPRDPNSTSRIFSDCKD